VQEQLVIQVVQQHSLKEHQLHKLLRLISRHDLELSNGHIFIQRCIQEHCIFIQELVVALPEVLQARLRSLKANQLHKPLRWISHHDLELSNGHIFIQKYIQEL
jgi:hypothetical protein